ncbi:WGR domain protein [Oesophagostomum dentatum]|uniref:WGR domain protein n=1 Tax=Oesophagostomum dentatum TaxID=61180 RepID=A0A0B1T977_OESDE|nr:WGR domain protein [Oesophagostomum dentatum]
MLIVESKHFELLSELHLSQKDWVFCDAKGDNLWHYAARTQDLRAVELFRLLETKAVPIKPNNDGSTPLHEAVQTCDCSANSVLEPIEWLLCILQYGRTPFHYAFASREQLIKGKLMDQLRDPIAVVSILARNMTKQQLDWTDCDGNTVLHLAAFKNANICAVTLLRKGVSVSIKNKADSCGPYEVVVWHGEGNSALAVAVLHGRQAIALTLIQAESSITDQVRSDQDERNTDLGIPKLRVFWVPVPNFRLRKFHVSSDLLKLEKNFAHVDFFHVKVFPPKPVSIYDPWKWKGAIKEKEEIKVSTIPAQIIAKGGGWEAMVYVLMDALGTDFTSLLQMIDASLRERQYNLANQLSKSLQARLLGKKLPKSDYNLLLSFAENFRGSLAVDGVEHAVLHRLYALGGEIMNDDGVSLPLEAAILNGQWELYKHFQVTLARAEMTWTSLRPSQPALGPLRNAVLRLSKGRDDTALTVVQELSTLPRFSINEPLSLPLPYELTEVSLSALPPIAWACTLEDPNTVSLLKKCGADVNATDSEGRTPLMIAIIANRMGAVQALCGDGLVQAVKPAQKKTVKNTSTRLLLSALGGKRKRKPSDSDNDERAESEDGSDGSPAKKQKISSIPATPDLFNVSNLVCQYKVNEDSKQFIESWLAEHEMESEPGTPKPSSMSGYSDTAELVRCPVTQQIMSLMKRRDTDLWILFTNWGRIGMGVGEFQTTPFTSFDAALKEFKSVWRSKTGQDWGPLDQFHNLPKKYRLVETAKRVSNLSEIDIKVKEWDEGDMVRKTIQDLSNVQKLKDYAKQINWDIKLPFGHITEAAIERARAILDRCEQNVKDLDATLEKENHTDADVLSIFEKSVSPSQILLLLQNTNLAKIGRNGLLNPGKK